MSGGLGRLQRGILAVLEDFPAGPTGEGYIGDLARPSDIIDRLGHSRTPSQRASMSRALARLEALGLVRSYVPQVTAPGRGRRYSRAD